MKILGLPFRVKKTILACGADLKGAFALAKGDRAYLFDGFDDLSDLDKFTKYEIAVKRAMERLGLRPQVVACDLHPGYFSTQFAKNYTQYAVRCTLYEVQHHEAHIASAIVDNDIKGDLLGVAFDGTGYGWDGNIWGGEFFIGNAKKFKRVAHLEYLPMPGGDMATREPWRMAASYLYSACGRIKKGDRHHFPGRTANRKMMPVPFFQMIEKNINSPLTSSMGRLFDAVGSLVLNREKAEFEAQLPIELEKIADRSESGYYDFELKKKDGTTIVNMSGTIRGILKDLDKRGQRPFLLKRALSPFAPKISAKFHNTIAFVILSAAKRFKAKKVVLSGGVFQNKLLVQRARETLKNGGFKVYMNSNVAVNDSGIPLGQVAIANARLSAFASNYL